MICVAFAHTAHRASGTVTRYYVWAGSRLICHIDSDGTYRYYHSNELGSTIALTDASGSVTDQFAYMPYGYAKHTGTTDTPFQWLGSYGVYYDADTQLHLTLYRAYSCDLKRFMQADPLGIDGGSNVYMMANLNPLWFIDPYGLCPEEQSWYQTLAGYAATALDVVLPDAQFVGVEMNGGFVGSMGGGVQYVQNYRSGEVSYFYYGSGSVGKQLGDASACKGLIWNCESNADYSGGFHSIDAGGKVIGGTLSVSGDTMLVGGKDWNISEGPLAISAGLGKSYTKKILRWQDSNYSEPITLPGFRPSVDNVTGMSLYLGHATLRWLEGVSH